MTWASGNPRPGQNPYTLAIDLTYGYPAGYTPLLAAGRAVILASTIGEESFTDLNGSGFYQPGDPFANLGDPYEDDNEQSSYELGDPFIDFYHTGVYAQPSGSFVGITCTGITAGSTCTTSTLAIGASHLMVMSTSLSYQPTTNAELNALITAPAPFTGTASAGFSITNGNSGSIIINVKDQNGNAMAAGTTITWGFSNTSIGVTLTPTPPTIVGCNGDLGGQFYQTSFASTAGQTGSGNLTITVTSPSGSATTYVVVVTIT
jgi:hypothetical protein